MAIEKMEVPGKTNEEVALPQRSLLTFSVALLVAGFVLLLPGMDTAMWYMLREMFGGGSHQGELIGLGLIALMGFYLQSRKFGRRGKLSWLLPLLSTVLLALAEFFWSLGGWDRLMSGVLWYVGLPVMMGSGVAVVLPFLLHGYGSFKRGTALLIAVAIVLGVVFWPRSVSRKTAFSPARRMLYYEPGGYTEWMEMGEEETVVEMLREILLVPCLSPPVWNDKRGILIRLDEEYVLVAKTDQTAYVYEYAGPLEEFSGGNLKWKVFRYSALYGPIRMHADWEESVAQG